MVFRLVPGPEERTPHSERDRSILDVQGFARMAPRRLDCGCNLGGSMSSTEPAPTAPRERLELPVAELLDRARPFPPSGEMRIDDVSEEEGVAFLAALGA